RDAARAAETFAKGGKWAVLIGIDNYFDDNIPPLRYAGADARLLAKVLEECGYPRDHILLLIDVQGKSYLKLLRLRLLEQLAGLLEKAREGDTFLVYFSGYGFRDDKGNAFLAPLDCYRSRLADTGVPSDKVRDVLVRCQASQKVLLLDCCRPDREKGEGVGLSGETLGGKLAEAKGLITLASCKDGEASWDLKERGRGLFAWCVAEALLGAADADR